MRATQHNGRKGKHGVYSVKHNDRQFNTDNAEHIDSERAKDNVYHRFVSKDEPKELTFEEHEQYIYEEIFGQYLQEKNERYIAQRHPERCQTMEQYRRNERSCPEETLYQIGKKNRETGEVESVSGQELLNIFKEYLDWERKTFPQLKTLDYSLHCDETTPHIHKRSVWVCHDKNGSLMVGQGQALKEMGIEAPDPSKKESRKNNAKMTFSKICREKWEEICLEHGISLESERLEPSETGKDLLQYQVEQDKKTIAKQQAMIEGLEQTIANRESLKTVTADLNKAVKNAGVIFNRVANENLDLKRPIFGNNNEVSLGSVQMASLTLKTELDQVKPVLQKLEQTEQKLSDMTKNEDQLIRQRAEDMVRQTQQQLLTDAQKAKEDRQKAEQARIQAEEYEQNQESYIRGTAENMANKKFEQFKKDLGRTDSRSDRLEDFCKDIKFKDGKSVLDKFKEKEQELERQMNHSWSIGR